MTRTTTKRSRKRRTTTDGKKNAELRIDLACGQNKREGFIGVDIADGADADIKHDLTAFPWPFDSSSADELFASHYVEHTSPVGGRNDGLIAFVDEAYRILRPDGSLLIVHPYVKSVRAFQDPTHTRFIPAETWWYFDRDWREAQKLDHYPIVSNFEVVSVMTDWLEPWNIRSPGAQEFGLRHYWEVVGDVRVHLRARKG